jgi:glutathione synthase
MAQELSRRPFKEFDLVWMRKDPPVDNNFIAALQMLGAAKRSGSRVVNDPEALLVANEKLWPLNVAADFMPRTLVSSSTKTLFEATQQMKKVVVKPLFESGGAGVMVFQSNDKNLKSALDLLTEQGKRPAMLQQFIEGAEKGDKRIILIGGKPVGAVLRIPGADDHRANLHVGGTAMKSDLSERELAICRHLEPLLISMGLGFVGIDVINGFLTEVNVTSPTGLQEIDRLNGYQGKARLRAKLVDYFLS